MGGVETHGGGSHGAEAAHRQRKGSRTGGHGKGPALRLPASRALSRAEMATGISGTHQKYDGGRKVGGRWSLVAAGRVSNGGG